MSAMRINTWRGRWAGARRRSLELFKGDEAVVVTPLIWAAFAVAGLFVIGLMVGAVLVFYGLKLTPDPVIPTVAKPLYIIGESKAQVSAQGYSMIVIDWQSNEFLYNIGTASPGHELVRADFMITAQNQKNQSWRDKDNFILKDPNGLIYKAGTITTYPSFTPNDLRGYLIFEIPEKLKNLVLEYNPVGTLTLAAKLK